VSSKMKISRQKYMCTYMITLISTRWLTLWTDRYTSLVQKLVVHAHDVCNRPRGNSGQEITTATQLTDGSSRKWAESADTCSQTKMILIIRYRIHWEPVSREFFHYRLA
jgi:hypothetical protein